LLGFVADCRLATGKQLTLRFWLAERDQDPARSRAARRTLKRLRDWRVLGTLPGRARGGVRGGSATLIYHVGGAGTKLLALRRAHQRRLGTPGERFIGHTLAATELAVRLHAAHTRGELELLGIQHEPQSWRFFTGAMGARRLIRPDLFVRIGAGRHEDRWFVEIDQGTEHPGTIASKSDRYLAHLRSGSEQYEHSVYPRVLWTVPDQHRARQLGAMLDRQPDELQALFSICVADEAVAFLAAEARS
jgi:Replication-relaxation